MSGQKRLGFCRNVRFRKSEFSDLRIRVSGTVFGSQVPGLGYCFRVAGFGFRVRDSGTWARVSRSFLTFSHSAPFFFRSLSSSTSCVSRLELISTSIFISIYLYLYMSFYPYISIYLYLYLCPSIYICIYLHLSIHIYQYIVSHLGLRVQGLCTSIVNSESNPASVASHEP